MTSKERLHQLIERLPDSELRAVERFLTDLVEADDTVLRAFEEAPEVDEPLSVEDEEAIDEGREDLARGGNISLEELRDRLRPAC